MTDGPQDGVMRLMEAVQDSLTDGMVERLATTSANTLEVVDKLNNEDTKEAVIDVIDKLTELHKLGAMDTLFNVALLAHGARSAMTDSMVERLFAFMEHMVTNLATEEVANMAHNAKEAMEEAADECCNKDSKGGMMSTLAMLSKPETQQAIKFLLTFAVNMKDKSSRHFED